MSERGGVRSRGKGKKVTKLCPVGSSCTSKLCHNRCSLIGKGGSEGRLGCGEFWEAVSMFSCAGFDWSLHFKWDSLSARRKALRVNQVVPIQ